MFCLDEVLCIKVSQHSVLLSVSIIYYAFISCFPIYRRQNVVALLLKLIQNLCTYFADEPLDGGRIVIHKVS